MICVGCYQMNTRYYKHANDNGDDSADNCNDDVDDDEDSGDDNDNKVNDLYK